MRNQVIKEIHSYAKKNNNLIFLTGDLGYNVINEFKNEFPKNVFNVGISEQNMTLMSTGLALTGKKVVTYSIGNFNTLRVLEHIRNGICYHNVDVKIISLAAGFAYGQLGFTHHATEDIGIMNSLPNLTIFSPADPNEAKECINKALELNSPCYIRLGRGGEKILYNKINKDISKALKIMGGKNLAILTTGTILEEALLAHERLFNEGIAVSVYSFPTLKPIDKKSIKLIAKKYKHIISIEENNLISGFGSIISSVIVEDNFDVSLIKMGINDEIPSIVGTQNYLRKIYKIDSDNIYNLAKSILNDTNSQESIR